MGKKQKKISKKKAKRNRKLVWEKEREKNVWKTQWKKIREKEGTVILEKERKKERISGKGEEEKGARKSKFMWKTERKKNKKEKVKK